jgi:hypothetical protein
MDHLLFSFQLLSLSVIVGGGIVLAGGSRPQFIEAMQQSQAVHELESLHINIWNAYNRFSLMAAVLFLLTEVISLTVTHQLRVFSFTLSVILVLLFIFKIMIDAKLRNRALKNTHAAYAMEQKKDHKIVEFISMMILLLATAGIFFI